ncbi:MAG: hypothetical protein R2724_00160 [Bryobacterales bacterium]
MGVQSFDHHTVRSASLRSDGDGFFAGGQFTIAIRFDERDCRHFEYRQKIRGTAYIQPGEFIGAMEPGNWVPTGEAHSVARSFAVPGGLRENFIEDGERRAGQVFHYGYRNNDPVQEEGLEDRYVPHPNGPVYRLRDTFGLRGDTRPQGARITIRLWYKGLVIDNRRTDDRPVLEQNWSYFIDTLFPLED